MLPQLVPAFEREARVKYFVTFLKMRGGDEVCVSGDTSEYSE